MSQLLLTPQELNIASRYGNNNFSKDAFNNSKSIPTMGSSFGYISGPVPYRNQDELSGQKQKGIAGDWRSVQVDYRRQQSRAALHTPFNYGAPFQTPR